MSAEKAAAAGAGRGLKRLLSENPDSAARKLGELAVPAKLTKGHSSPASRPADREPDEQASADFPFNTSQSVGLETASNFEARNSDLNASSQDEQMLR